MLRQFACPFFKLGRCRYSSSVCFYSHDLAKPGLFHYGQGERVGAAPYLTLPPSTNCYIVVMPAMCHNEQWPANLGYHQPPPLVNANVAAPRAVYYPAQTFTQAAPVMQEPYNNGMNGYLSYTPIASATAGNAAVTAQPRQECTARYDQPLAYASSRSPNPSKGQYHGSTQHTLSMEETRESGNALVSAAVRQQSSARPHQAQRFEPYTYTGARSANVSGGGQYRVPSHMSSSINNRTQPAGNSSVSIPTFQQRPGYYGQLQRSEHSTLNSSRSPNVSGDQLHSSTPLSRPVDNWCGNSNAGDATHVIPPDQERFDHNEQRQRSELSAYDNSSRSLNIYEGQVHSDHNEQRQRSELSAHDNSSRSLNISEGQVHSSTPVPTTSAKKCGLCDEIVLQKEPEKAYFGILTGCKHAFCLECIRAWNTNPQISKSEADKCPTCGTPFDVYCSSSFWIDEDSHRRNLFQNYFNHLKTIPCKRFIRSRGACRFGSSCFYKHHPDLIH